jgi:hypothetical protein
MGASKAVYASIASRRLKQHINRAETLDSSSLVCKGEGLKIPAIQFAVSQQRMLLPGSKRQVLSDKVVHHRSHIRAEYGEDLFF